MTREEMLNNMDRLLRDIPNEIRWKDVPDSEPLVLTGGKLRLFYGARPSTQELQATLSGMRQLAQTGSGPAEAVSALVKILGVEPSQFPENPMTRHIAGVLADWSALQLASTETFHADGSDLALRVLSLGPLIFCFVAAEVFVETALTLRDAFPDQIVNIVGYASPLQGYLPTDEAIDRGGYEPSSAYIFFGFPGPWQKGSEPAVVQTLTELIGCVIKNRS